MKPCRSQRTISTARGTSVSAGRDTQRTAAGSGRSGGGGGDIVGAAVPPAAVQTWRICLWAPVGQLSGKLEGGAGDRQVRTAARGRASERLPGGL